MKHRSYCRLACALTLTASVICPPFAFAAPAEESAPTAKAESPAETTGPADPELAAKVRAAIEEDIRGEALPSPRSEEEKEALRRQLTIEQAGGEKAGNLVPEGMAPSNQYDQSGIDEFLAEGKEGIPVPVAPKDADKTGKDAAISDDAVAKAISQKGDEQTSQSLAAGEDRPAAEGRTMDDWAAGRPAEPSINSSVKQYIGQTIVAVDLEGVSDETAEPARVAILSRPGDIFTTASLDKDRDAIYNTGLFYDIYPSVKTVPEGVIVTYHVMENPRLNKLEIVGNTVETTEELRKLIKAEEGKVLNTRQLHENVQAIDARYHDDGYILVKIGDLDINRDGVLKIVINEGTLEGYTVKGNTKTRERVILREMRQKPGEPFNAKKARRGMQRVYNLGYFEDVNMKLNAGVEPNAVVLEIDVVEKRSGNFTIGAGYSSQDGLLAMVGIGDTNFFGTGDSINLIFEMSGDDEDAHGFQFSYRKPWLDRHETAGVFRIYNRTYEYSDYDTSGHEIEEFMRKYSGGEITLSRPQSEFVTNYITFRHRKDKYVKHSTGEGTDRSTDTYKTWRDKNFGLTRSIIADHVTDTRDNVHSPTGGSRQSIQGEFGGFGGDFTYQKYTYDDQHYFKVGHAQVIAFHGVYGYGTGHISEFNAYRIGGQNSLRGYRDDQFRGKHAAFGSLEYRFPLVKKVDMALFTDFGAAWRSGWSPKKWHQSVGAGVSLSTPMGPVRLDYGYGSQGGRVHFSVGGAF